MVKSRWPVTFAVVFLVVATLGTCYCCQNMFSTFQEILQTRQFDGRLRGTAFRLFVRNVFTTMECLDVCLRNEHCTSFETRKKMVNGTMKTHCKINHSNLMNASETMQFQVRNEGKWLHYNVSSMELQKILRSATQSCHKAKLD